MIYPWRCKHCPGLTEVERRLADMDVPPDVCEHCNSTEFTERAIVPMTSKRVKGYILLGQGWHADRYTKYRSVD